MERQVRGRALRGRGRHRGFSLIELMIAVVVGAAIIAIVTRMAAGTLATYRSDEYLARLQENARFAIEQLDFAGRMAGFSGCSRNINSLLNTAAAAYEPGIYDITRVFSGWEYDSTGDGDDYSIATLDPVGAALGEWSDAGGNDLVDDLQNLVVPGTDVLVVKYADRVLDVGASGTTAANAVTIGLTGNNGISQNSLVLISDCVGSDLFQNRAANNAAQLSRTDSGGSPGNVAPASANLSHAFGTDMEIYTFTVAVYFVGRGPSGEPALFRRTHHAAGVNGVETLELVEGVENMQILYGEDLDGDRLADVYRTSDAVADWADVVAARVGLLLRTVESGRQENDTAIYELLGTNVTPLAADARRHRRVFTTTIALRNRVG
ncbi:MAG: PilW family protein [Porticoccaceae bacterium]